jgi:hypothetical protein
MSTPGRSGALSEWSGGRAPALPWPQPQGEAAPDARIHTHARSHVGGLRRVVATTDSPLKPLAELQERQRRTATDYSSIRSRQRTWGRDSVGAWTKLEADAPRSLPSLLRTSDGTRRPQTVASGAGPARGDSPGGAVERPQPRVGRGDLHAVHSHMVQQQRRQQQRSTGPDPQSDVIGVHRQLRPSQQHSERPSSVLGAIDMRAMIGAVRPSGSLPEFSTVHRRHRRSRRARKRKPRSLPPLSRGDQHLLFTMGRLARPEGALFSLGIERDVALRRGVHALGTRHDCEGELATAVQMVWTGERQLDTICAFDSNPVVRELVAQLLNVVHRIYPLQHGAQPGCGGDGGGAPQQMAPYLEVALAKLELQNGTHRQSPPSLTGPPVSGRHDSPLRTTPVRAERGSPKHASPVFDSPSSFDPLDGWSEEEEDLMLTKTNPV